MKGLVSHSLMIIAIISSLTSISFGMKFNYDVEPNQMQCIGEYLTENTVAIFTIRSLEKAIVCQVFNPSGGLLYQKDNKPIVKVSITAVESGNYQLCVSNRHSTSTEISFEFLSGIGAKDYSDIAKESNLKPVEISLQKLEDMIKYLIQEMSTVMKQKETDLSINDSLSSKIIVFSIITLIAMVVVGIIETLYIQKYLYNRKII